MAKEEIILRLKADGSRELEANGFIGKACERATAKMTKELGKKSAEKRKPVYNQQETDKSKQVQW